MATNTNSNRLSDGDVFTLMNWLNIHRDRIAKMTPKEVHAEMMKTITSFTFDVDQITRRAKLLEIEFSKPVRSIGDYESRSRRVNRIERNLKFLFEKLGEKYRE